MAINAYAEKFTYRVFQRNDKMILEFDVTLIDEDNDIQDKIVKQLVLTDNLDMPIGELDAAVQTKLAEYEQSFEGA